MGQKTTINLSRSQTYHTMQIVLAFGAAMICGCAVAPAPIQNTSQAVATPLSGELSVSVGRASPVGGVIPVFVSIANGTDIPRAVVPNQIFAVDDTGQRAAPIPPGEAARLGGGAGELRAALVSGTVSGAAGGALGAGLGAAAGAVSGDAGPGAIIGAAIGAAYGIFGGVWAGQSKADEQANQQIQALALQPQDVNHNFTVGGYVFYPTGSYREIDILMVNRESGATEIVKRPWP